MENLNRLVDMGFSHELAQNALRMADNDAEKAIGYLLNDLVEITNKADVPDINDLKPHASAAPVPDYFEGGGNRMSFNEAHYEDKLHIELLSDESDNETLISLPLPELRPRDDELPVVVLNKRVNKFENWFPPIIQTLCQIDEFKQKLARVKPKQEQEEVKEEQEEDTNICNIKSISQMVKDIETNGNNYVVNELNLAAENILLVEELIPKIYEFIGTAYEKVFNDKFFHDLVASNVQSIQDSSSQDLTIIEIDTDYRFPSIYDTLNELFWGKSLENLNNIVFNRIGDVLTLHYIGDEEEYFNIPLDLQDIIYPDIYSKKMLPTLMEKTEQFTRLNESKVRLSNQIMHLLIFQGKKINSFLNQTKNFIQDENVHNKLENLTGKLADDRAKLNEDIASLIKQIDHCNIKNPNNLIDETLTAYKLIGVIVNDANYFYYVKRLNNWVHVAISSDLEFDQEILAFEEVKEIISQLSGSRLLPVTLMYCSSEKLAEEVNPDQIQTILANNSTSQSTTETTPASDTVQEKSGTELGESQSDLIDLQ